MSGGNQIGTDTFDIGSHIIQITDDEIVVIENISVETSDNGRAVRRVRYHLVETEIFSINNYFRVGY